MKEHLIKMFAYDAWANEKVIEALPAENQEIVNLMLHIEAAKHIWKCRILGFKRELSTFPEGSIDLINYWYKRNKEEYTHWLMDLNAEALEKITEGVNAKRQSYALKVQDVLVQLINHGTYHRAQIATKMRALNLTPVATDYLLYVQWLSNE